MSPTSASLAPSKPDVPTTIDRPAWRAPPHVVEHGRWAGEVDDDVTAKQHVARVTDVDRGRELEIGG